MHNLNVNLAATAATAVNNLLVESTCTTPRTPEILNSLIAMTNPLDNYNFNNKILDQPPTNMSSDSNSSSCSQIESPTTNNPPSVQHTCSQLIKAGLKLSIEQKRKHQSDGEDLLDLDKCNHHKRVKRMECSESEEDKHNKLDGLTPEDEERRRRRRERNKIAATKCRLKKRERTANLVNESETLETQNVDLKTQLQELQNQKRSLLEIITMHRPHCQHNIAPATRDALYLIPPVATLIENHSYLNNSRPASVNTTTTTNNNNNQNSFRDIYTSSRPASVGIVSANLTYSTSRSSSISNYAKPPSIIIEEISDNYQPQLTDLDNNNTTTTTTYHYNTTQCHNNYNNNQTYASGMDSGCMA